MHSDLPVNSFPQGLRLDGFTVRVHCSDAMRATTCFPFIFNGARRITWCIVSSDAIQVIRVEMLPTLCKLGAIFASDGQSGVFSCFLQRSNLEAFSFKVEDKLSVDVAAYPVLFDTSLYAGQGAGSPMWLVLVVGFLYF